MQVMSLKYTLKDRIPFEEVVNSARLITLLLPLEVLLLLMLFPVRLSTLLVLPESVEPLVSTKGEIPGLFPGPEVKIENIVGCPLSVVEEV